MSVVKRPETGFDGPSHTYTLKDEELLGVSSVAKMGGAEETWGIASAWGFRIGYEGAYDLAATEGRLEPFDVKFRNKQGEQRVRVGSRDTMREALKGRGLTPWTTRDKAAKRGTAVHDLLERLAQNGTVPTREEILAMPEGERGHVLSVVRWFLHFRPIFVATEVQVTSERHRFAGRYDIRATIDARRLVPNVTTDPSREDAQAARIFELAAREDGVFHALGLIDLKTSKSIYPTTHFPQLEGYEGGSVEMGFPATDFRAVLNTNEDGSFDPIRDFQVSWSTYDDFLAYAEALRAIRRIKAGDPEIRRAKRLEADVLALLPGYSRDIAPQVGSDSKAVGQLLGKLRKSGLVTQERGVWSLSAVES